MDELQNYLEQNYLPQEIKYEILKHIPTYRTINTSLNKDVEKFYKDVCHKKINLKEIKNYDKTMYIFTPMPNQLYIIKVSNDIYVYHFKNIHVRILFNATKISFDKLKDYINNHSYCDMISSYYIYQNRNCNFNENQLMLDIKQFEQNVQTINIDTLFYNIQKFYYHWVSTDHEINAISLSDVKQYNNKNINQNYDLDYDDLLQSLLRQMQYL